jgi:GT2 family glycosyltransferase
MTIVLTIEQVGVESMNKDSKYVLFLDDDVRLHPGSIGALTHEMEKNPEVYLINMKFGLPAVSNSMHSHS